MRTASTDRARASGTQVRRVGRPGGVAQRLSALSALTRIIASSQSHEAALDAIVQATVAALDAKMARVWIDDSDAQILRAGATHFAEPGFQELLTRPTLNYGEGVGGRVFVSRAAAYIGDVQQEPAWIERRLVREARLHACAALPLGADGRIIGVLLLLFSDSRAFPEEEREFMALLADFAAIALRNAEAFTNEQRSRAAAEKAEHRYRTLFEGVPLGLFRATPKGELLDANTALAELVGSPDKAALLGSRIQDFFADPSDHERLSDLLERDGIVRGFEVRLRRRDGSIRWARVSVRVARDAREQAVHHEGAVEDVMELRQAETQFRQMQRVESVGRLTGGIAHDFNNLLTVIGSRSQLLLRRLGVGDPHRRQIELIDGAASRAAALTRKLLAFSRQQVLEPKPLNLNLTLVELLPLLRRLISEDIEIATALADDLWTVMVDPAQLEQAIINLVVNARDAMPGGGTLRLETANTVLDDGFARVHPGSTSGPHVRITVRDTGLGMTPDVLSHVFEPFFTTKEPDKGTGLGLSTTYGIVKQHGGYIDITSAVGRGTTVSIYFPAVDEPAETVRQPRPRPVSVPRGGETVLLVEDDEGVRTSARESLQDYGYTVLEAGHPDLAVRLVEERQGRIDLLVSDIVMPGMDGVTLAARLREFQPELKILFVSGYGDPALIRKVGATPNARLLSKPFGPEMLARAVRDALDETLVGTAPHPTLGITPGRRPPRTASRRRWQRRG